MAKKEKGKKEKTELEQYLDNYFPQPSGLPGQDAEALQILIGNVAWIFDLAPDKAKSQIRRYMQEKGLLEEDSI